VRALVGLLLVAALASGQDAATGTIEGTVIPPKARKPRKDPYPGAKPAPYVRGPSVVFLDGVKGDFKPPAEKLKLEQKDQQFAPLALPVVKGTTIAFPNLDDEYHNVFSRSKAMPMELGRYGKGEAPERTFDTPGVVRLRCEVHPHMHAVILVLENTHFAVCDAEGRFTLKDVPPGKYRLYAFHEEYEPKEDAADPMRAVGRDVEVTAGGTLKSDFDLSGK
jgi:plastocyanin